MPGRQSGPLVGLWLTLTDDKKNMKMTKLGIELTVVHMGNHRHVPDVILLVHDPADLLHSELHLQNISERVRTRQNEEVIANMQRC
jgi:hypothetical protein